MREDPERTRESHFYLVEFVQNENIKSVSSEEFKEEALVLFGSKPVLIEFNELKRERALYKTRNFWQMRRQNNINFHF